MALLNYDIDFTKMIKMLLPTFKRKPIRISWLKAITKPERNLHDTFLDFFEAKKYEVKWSGQKIKLEQLLIDQFGPGIYIENNDLELNGAFVGTGDDVTSFIGAKTDVSVYIDESYSIAGVSFTVYVPAAITFSQAEMEAFIDQYKLYGTTYEIVII
jgi:hypothetical protein